MRILLVMDPGIPIPPKGYGGIERIVALLAMEYRSQGHKVDILASEGSFLQDCCIHFNGPQGFPPSKSVRIKAIFKSWNFLLKNYTSYDLIQNFGRLLYLFPILNSRVTKIMCYQREISKSNIQIINKLPTKRMFFSGCSRNLINRTTLLGNWVHIHNGIDFSKFDLNRMFSKNAPLIFLGRIERVKGCHIAIQVAKESGNDLIIAGNISKLPEEIEYFNDEVLPHIDNLQIKYVGEVDDFAKCNYLKMSKALLMPILWNEPFGIVMIESMACGTPVIAFDKGSVGEVIDESLTGFKVENILEMIDAVSNLNIINRSLCRQTAFEKFNISFIANKYLSIANK